MSHRALPAVAEPDRFCLHRPRPLEFCYRPTSHVLVRPSDGFAVPVCDEHVEAAQLALNGNFEVVPLPMWLAAWRGAETAGVSG